MTTLRIATWNVAYGINRTRNDRILEKMTSVDADIWILTETHDGLRPPTPGAWEAAVSSQRQRGPKDVIGGSRWVTIWSRLPVVEKVTASYDPERTASSVVGTPLGSLLIFGTVLPWYQDTGRRVREEIARQSSDWVAMQASRNDIPVCVAGDFNVNLGGPHYYGRKEDIEAVRSTLSDRRLTALTGFERTGPTQLKRFGLIDHIAVSDPLAAFARSPSVWQRENARGETMSDHCGVAVHFAS